MGIRRLLALQAMTVVVLLSSAASSATAQMVGYNPKHSANQQSISVSLIQLIANPERYNGKPVRLIGFLRLEFEGDALYLHREDYERGLPNGIWVDEGIFRVGHLDQFGGKLTTINRIEVWPSGRDPK
jgi:hypothetical protein